MKFLYKIHSGYDGFIPSRIPSRLEGNKFLWLGWSKYIDSVEKGQECWIYFHGQHSFTNGVYIKGFVAEIDRANQRVLLRVREHSVSTPLTDPATTARIADTVSVRYRQVFLWPTEWDHIPKCGIENCKIRLCDNCETWKKFPLIDENHLSAPERLSGHYKAYVPAYWIIPSRCYAYREAKALKRSVHTITHVFSNFKLGEGAYSYPLALGIYHALNNRDLLDFDIIIPIPLSPDKIAAKELHRTLLLSKELARLLGTKVKESLSLNKPISKRAMISSGYTVSQFENSYYRSLDVENIPKNIVNVLLVDDVGTKGSTTTQAVRRLLEANNDLNIVIATAGQMIVKAAINDENGFLQ